MRQVPATSMDGFLYPFSTGEKMPDLEEIASNVRLSMSCESNSQ
jgi:hypothetical protein